jgi:hypothetical protein
MPTTTEINSKNYPRKKAIINSIYSINSENKISL